MFSGIIEAIGTVEEIKTFGQDHRFVINTGKLDLSDIHVSESIAVSGVCLTVIEMSGSTIAADVSSETLACTSFATSDCNALLKAWPASIPLPLCLEGFPQLTRYQLLVVPWPQPDEGCLAVLEFCSQHRTQIQLDCA